MNFEPLLDYKKKIMEELTLTTPALLFSAVSLILLAYTNLCANCVTATWKTLRISLKHKSRIYGNG